MIVTGGAGIAALMEAPTSVVAFDAEALRAANITDVGGLADYTPSLEINSPFAASNPQLFIRGVGLQDSNSNATAAVAVVVDGVYLSSPAGQLSALYDVQNVEVLRGPQGAQYGRNASAGVIRITTNRPVHEHKASLNASYGRFNEIETNGYLNVPIIQDVLATRFAFTFSKRDPLGTNRCNEFRDINDAGPNQLFGTKCFVGMVREPRRSFNDPIPRPPADTHDRENWFARSSWLLEPAEDLSFHLNFHGGQNLGLAPQFQHRGIAPEPDPVNGGFFKDFRTDSQNFFDFDTCTAVAANGSCFRNDRQAGAGDPYDGDFGRGGDERLTLGGLVFNADWSTGPWTFANALGVEYSDREVVIDFDASPFVEADAFVEDTAYSILEDLKVTWDDDRGIALTIGAQFLYENLEAQNNFWNNPRTNLFQEYEQETYAAAGFGYLEYELTENLTFEGGARVNYERKEFLISSRLAVFANNQFVDPPLLGFVDRLEVAEQVRPSGEIILRFEPTDDVKFYGRFTRGYKGQHFNGNALSEAQSIEPVEAEFVNSFEVGWSAAFLDGVASWNGAAFFYDYENQQVFQLQDAPGISIPVPILINAEDSRLIGLESDLTLAWEGIRWFNSVSFLYSEYSDFQLISTDFNAPIGGGVPQPTFEVDDFSGNQLVNAPEFNLVGQISYDWEIPLGGTLTPRFDYRYKTQVFYTPENDSRIGADPFWIFDVRLEYKAPGGMLGIAGWVRNIGDLIYPVTAFDRKEGTGAIVYVVSDPRTYGLSVSLQF